jgi:predicted dithiol-disulfide oxidoreductase (DUF899 family)
MTKHSVGTQAEWRAARSALHEREHELGSYAPDAAFKKEETR